MLNFRKLKHDFSPSILKEGKTLYDKNMVVSTKIVHLKPDAVRLSCRVMGTFDNCYESELEIDRNESIMIDADCDCPYEYDCQHLTAVLFYLEAHYDELLVAYSKDANMAHIDHADENEKVHLMETLKEAETKECARLDKKQQKELLREYIHASQILGQSPLFHSEEDLIQEKAELAIVYHLPQTKGDNPNIEIQLALRLPMRSKALNISQIKSFLDAIRYHESIYLGGKRHYFSMASFDQASAALLGLLMSFVRFSDIKNDKLQRVAYIDREVLGALLSASYEIAESCRSSPLSLNAEENEVFVLPCIYASTIEEPLQMSMTPAKLRFELDYLEIPSPKILLKPQILIKERSVTCEEVVLFDSARPGLIFQGVYYSFQSNIKRKHLRSLISIRNMTIPEPLFGTFVENSLLELKRYAEISNRDIIDRFATLPFVENVGAECDIHYLNGELEATLYFVYGNVKIPAAPSQIQVDHILTFTTQDGILARNLTEEQQIIDLLFQDFVYDAESGLYSAKNEKKIVEFMTEIIPMHQQRVRFNCPENLLDQFIYDHSLFKLNLRESSRIDQYEVEIIVEGHLQGMTVDQLWDCLSSKRAFIELTARKPGRRQSKLDDGSKMMQKVLVLDLEKLAPVVQVLDEMGINSLHNHVEQRPLWSLASLDIEQFKGLPIEFTITAKLQKIQQQILGNIPYDLCEMPAVMQASFRNYQLDGIRWLDRLRKMHLNGILADDMGLGKTLQAITVLTQYHMDYPGKQSIVICPTSLVHNWKEEISKFNPTFKVLPVDGTPQQRKKLLSEITQFDLIVTSYTLLQKDIEFYKTISFGYAILDEAQYIKNRGTRNAQSVKMIQTAHRLILTGTPIENSLDELWSLFDFLMPGLLSSYDRFVEKFVRFSSAQHSAKNLEQLKRKVSPFILRRMKKDVLSDLPPISEIVYHCHLSDTQQQLYHSYAASAREELSRLVKNEGFDRVQIHVLATLTRLKQICCHPAIFAKDHVEIGDSAKYDMLLELLQNLMEGGHKTVIFSQYTRMLNIMRNDLQKKGIRFEYLDGSSKNRLSIVKKFNEDQNIPIFLVSLKAGGSGLNLVGADTVIHYDMWWNPAVENQATDRVYRMGQKNSVSAYKLITLNTIEEKILEMHNRKRGLVKDVVSRDEEMMSKLTWEEVLELLQT